MYTKTRLLDQWVEWNRQYSQEQSEFTICRGIRIAKELLLLAETPELKIILTSFISRLEKAA